MTDIKTTLRDFGEGFVVVCAFTSLSVPFVMVWRLAGANWAVTAFGGTFVSLCVLLLITGIGEARRKHRERSRTAEPGDE